MKEQIPVVVNQTFLQPIDVVWDAITDLSQMQQWFFENIKEFSPVLGFETSFMVKTPNHDFLHLWKIIEVIPNKKIVYDWSYPDFEGNSLVIWELTEMSNVTTLTLTCTGIETYPQGIQEFTRSSCEGGWKYFIQKNLVEYLKNL